MKLTKYSDTEKTAAQTTSDAVQAKPVKVFGDRNDFETAQRHALALASSSLVPQNYRGTENVGNILIAMDIRQCMPHNVSILAVMQNLHVIQGKPSWSSTFVISLINSCGRFEPLEFEIEGEGDDRWCVASAVSKISGKVQKSPRITIGTAKKAGWYNRNGSQWPVMPDLMLMYRAAAWFGRVYAPEALTGMTSCKEEVEDGFDVENLRSAAPPAETKEPKNAAPGLKGAPEIKARKKAPAAPPPPPPPVIDADAEPVPDEKPPLPEPDIEEPVESVAEEVEVKLTEGQQMVLAEFSKNKVTWDQVRKAAAEAGWWDNADALYADIAEIPDDLARWLIKNIRGVVVGAKNLAG